MPTCHDRLLKIEYITDSTIFIVILLFKFFLTCLDFVPLSCKSPLASWKSVMLKCRLCRAVQTEDFFFSLDSVIKLYHCVMYFTEGWIVNAISESSQIRVKLIVLSLLIIHFVSIFFFILQVMTFKLMNDTSKLLIFDLPPGQLVLHLCIFGLFIALLTNFEYFQGQF